MVFAILGMAWGLINKFFNLMWRLLFAPGIILHECGHLLFCRLTNTKVLEYQLLNFDLDSDAAGYVSHEPPDDSWERFLISFGPLSVNSTVSILAMLINELSMFLFSLQLLIFLWIGFTAAFTAMPSFVDVSHLPGKILQDFRSGKWIFLILLPPAVFMYVFSFIMILSRVRFCVGVIYYGILFLLSKLIFSLLSLPITACIT